MNTNIIGYSVSGIPLLSYQWEKKDQAHVLILAGVHGDEVEGQYVSHALFGEFEKNYPYSIQLTLIPLMNPDGALQRRRTNENLVDLNRNLPTKDWSPQYTKEKYHPGPHPNSEPENQALTQWIKNNHPDLVLSLHSWKPMLNVNGDCLPEAEILSKETGYKIEKHIGYPTPGSLGTYCGLERNIPTITYEVERGLAFKKAVELHVPAIKKALFLSQNRKKRELYT